MAKRKSNKLLYILGGLLVLLIVGLLVAKKSGLIGKEEGIEVAVAKAKPTNIVEKVSASGKVQPEIEVKISPDVSGEITELYVKEGDSVVAGQLLLRIRPDNYQAMVEMQSASVSTQRANLAQARARLDQAEANSKNIRQSYERNRKLFEQKVISQSEWDAARSQFEANKAEVDAARQSVRAAESTVRSASASLEESRRNLDKTTIYAPVSGTVSKLNVEKGERVVGTSQMAGTEIMRIANLNNMEIRVDVNENDIVRVKLGDSAIVEVDSYTNTNRKFKGVVTSIANTAKDATTLEAVTEFEVRIRLLNDSYNDLIQKNGRTPFRPGMTASVDIITEQKTNVLSVPLASVTTRAKEKAGAKAAAEKEQNQNQGEKPVRAEDKPDEVVFVHEGGRVKMVKVTTGISDFDNIEILSGIKPGQEVVSGPFRAVSKQLKDGDLITVKDEKSLSQNMKETTTEEE
ncbi:HlyD family efflux transporter periplasmic adaptor subunit [Rufibacter immobilis]|uniref:HlyD family efflux transporter periplasmic adaptor subunit n=1 Tax=Rufibacter immobilis TaxID=1348778 RepID=A0A3M9MS74_9BACT|nr:efflux RND transporter periplasmic adaptor subunit [Rufibacter immobilis]RNI27743.1 HlyD family efflux transporter periplasmic adaptor subunit [Rufibacter immobilis]